MDYSAMIVEFVAAIALHEQLFQIKETVLQDGKGLFNACNN